MVLLLHIEEINFSGTVLLEYPEYSVLMPYCLSPEETTDFIVLDW